MKSYSAWAILRGTKGTNEDTCKFCGEHQAETIEDAKDQAIDFLTNVVDDPRDWYVEIDE